MDAKLNHSDLSQLLSKEAGLTMVKAEALTKALFDLIIEGLAEDGIVKINSLGTFKITEVADRSSVNVNTGEKFEIKGHNKLTFVPAESLKDEVNQPFAMFEPVEVNADLCDEEQALEEQENEISDNLPEIAAEETVTEVAEEVVETSTTSKVEEKEETLPENVIAEKHVEAVSAPAKRPEPVLVRVPKKDKGMKKDAPKEKKNNKPYYIVLLAAMLVAMAYLLYNADMDIFKSAEKCVPAQENIVATNVVKVTEEPVVKQEPVAVEVVENVKVVEEKSEAYAFVMVEELETRDLAKITVADTDLYTITGELCRHSVKSNETLTRIALKYYGSKKLWPYLVKHNKLARPDALGKGMDISIPMLEPVE